MGRPGRLEDRPRGGVSRYSEEGGAENFPGRGSKLPANSGLFGRYQLFGILLSLTSRFRSKFYGLLFGCVRGSGSKARGIGSDLALSAWERRRV